MPIAHEESPIAPSGAAAWWIPVIVVGAVAAIPLWGWVVVEQWLTTAEGPALFGDAFAPLTGLLTAGALVLAALSFRLQQLELKAQRLEFAASRRAQERLADAQRDANSLAAAQLRIESTKNTIAVTQLHATALQMELDLVRFADTYGQTNWIVAEPGIRRAIDASGDIVRAADEFKDKKLRLSGRVQTLKYVAQLQDALNTMAGRLDELDGLAQSGGSVASAVPATPAQSSEKTPAGAGGADGGDASS